MQQHSHYIVLLRPVFNLPADHPRAAFWKAANDANAPWKGLHVKLCMLAPKSETNSTERHGNSLRSVIDAIRKNVQDQTHGKPFHFVATDAFTWIASSRSDLVVLKLPDGHPVLQKIAATARQQRLVGPVEADDFNMTLGHYAALAAVAPADVQLPVQGQEAVNLNAQLRADIVAAGWEIVIAKSYGNHLQVDELRESVNL